jgi:outer membrane immunogenic protein
MYKKALLASCVAGIASMGGSAYAADLGAVPVGFSWNNMYIGANLGWAQADPRKTPKCDVLSDIIGENGDSFGSNACESESTQVDGSLWLFLDGDFVDVWKNQGAKSTDSFIYGGQVGINRQRGNLVVGLEADLQGFSDSSSTSTVAFDYYEAFPFEFYEGTFTVKTKSELDWLGTIRGRLGWAMGDEGRLLPYVTGGFAVAGVSTSMSTSMIDQNDWGWCDACYFGTTRGSKNLVQAGPVIGGGVEYAFRSGWSLAFEYLHVDLSWGDDQKTVHFYGDDRRGFDVIQNVGFDSLDIVRGKVNYLF